MHIMTRIYIYIYCRRAATYGHIAAKVAIATNLKAKRRAAGTDVASRPVSAPGKCGSFGIVTDREHRGRAGVMKQGNPFTRSI
jgi:hypothetical protein